MLPRERRGWYVEKFFRTPWYMFFGGSVSSDDLHGLSRVPFVGVVDVFSFRVTASLFQDGFKLWLFLAHLSRRLIGELIVYPWSGVRRPSSSVVCPQCSNIFFSETAWPIEAKFYVEPPWVGGTKFCSQHLGHMTKMAATPIYGKNPSKIFFSRSGRPISRKLGM